MTCEFCKSTSKPFFVLVHVDDEESNLCGICLIQVAEIFKNIF